LITHPVQVAPHVLAAPLFTELVDELADRPRTRR
jgi:hypothetical protein